MKEFLSEAVPAPYTQAQFQLAGYAEKKWHDYYNSNKTVYVHTGWFDPNTGDVIVTREELQLEAYAYYYSTNCNVLDATKNADIATTYFTANFADIVQFADWNTAIPVNVPLKDNVNVRVSALVASLNDWNCEHNYVYPENSNTTFGI